MVGASLIDSDKKFYAWDLLTVAQLVHPEMFTNTEVTCDIVADGLSQGRVIRTGTHVAPYDAPLGSEQSSHKRGKRRVTGNHSPRIPKVNLKQ